MKITPHYLLTPIPPKQTILTFVSVLYFHTDPEQVVVWCVHVRRVEQLGRVLLHGQHPASLLHFRRQVSNSNVAYLMSQFEYSLWSLEIHKRYDKEYDSFVEKLSKLFSIV